MFLLFFSYVDSSARSVASRVLTMVVLSLRSASTRNSLVPAISNPACRSFSTALACMPLSSATPVFSPAMVRWDRSSAAWVSPFTSFS